jgi:hypothetical protein
MIPILKSSVSSAARGVLTINVPPVKQLFGGFTPCFRLREHSNRGGSCWCFLISLGRHWIRTPFGRERKPPYFDKPYIAKSALVGGGNLTKLSGRWRDCSIRCRIRVVVVIVLACRRSHAVASPFSQGVITSVTFPVLGYLTCIG